MVQSLLYWCDLYKKLRYHALCLDVECTGSNGPLSVIGLYRPKEGEIDCISLVKGKNLNSEELKKAFEGCKLLITYNGLSFYIKKIDYEFPGVLPKVPVLDLYLFAKKLNLDTNLKVLETTLGIDRLYEFTKKRDIAVKLWQKYIKNHREETLNQLIEYNKQDAINLYPLAEKLVEMALERIEG